MKKYFITIAGVLGLFFLTVQYSYAHTESANKNHYQPMENILSNILSKQNASIIQEIDCSKINDEDLEQLGDAIMEKQNPGESHDVMDNMMGGEGSETLHQMHINMGKNYLGCNQSNNFGMMGMMSPFYKNSTELGDSFMMGAGQMMGLGAGITWITFVAFLFAGIYFFIKQANKK